MQDYEQRLGDELSSITTRIIGDILQGKVNSFVFHKWNQGFLISIEFLKYLYNVWGVTNDSVNWKYGLFSYNYYNDSINTDMVYLF